MKVRYQGFKGHDGDYDLGRACLVTGENDTGKSSLVAAVHFALSKKLAAMRMGKGDTQDPGRLLKAIDDGGWAEVELDGTTVRRVLEATAKKARVLTECGGLDGKEGEAEAARLSGDLIFADFRRLVAAGDKERADVLATYLPQPADAEKRRWALGQAIYHMDAALRPQKKRGKKTEPALAGRMSKEDATKARTALMALAEANGCKEEVLDIFTFAAGMSDKSTEELIAELRRTSNVADDARKNAGKVAAEAAKAKGDREAAKEIPALEEQVNQLRARNEQEGDAEGALERWVTQGETLGERIDELRTDLAAKKGEATDVDAAKTTVAEAKTKVADAQRGRPEPTDAATLDALVARAEPLRDELARLRPLATTTNSTASALARTEEQLTSVGTEPQAPDDDIEALRAEREDIIAKVAAWKASGGPLNERRKAAKAGTCPLILEACPVPKKLTGFADNAWKELDTLSKTVNAANGRIAEIAAEIRGAENALAEHRVDVGTWIQNHAAARGALRTAKAAAQEASRAAERLPQVEAELDPITREIELLEAARNEHDLKFTEWAGEVAGADATLATAKTALTDAEAVASRVAELAADVTRAESELEALGESRPEEYAGEDASGLQAAEEQLQAAHAAQARLDVLGGLDIDALTVNATLRKAAHQGSAEGLMRCVQAATEPISKKVTEALHRMDIKGDFYVDLEAKSFGIIEDGKRIDVEVLGGGKAVLFAAAMLSALPPKEGPRVLTMEGAELHPKWMTRLLKGLDIEAFDAVLIVTCNGATAVPDAWSHIEMREAA